METRLLQIASSFTCTPIAHTLRPFVVNAGIADELGFSQYAQMTEYLLGPAPDSRHIVGTVIMVRVEDWLRDDLKSSSFDYPSDSLRKARQNLRVRVDEFVTQLAALSRRGKRVWFLACPSTGWVSDRHKLETLCRTYTNLLTARVQNLPQITMLNWPASLFANELNDRSADRLGQIPFALDAFDRLGGFVGQHIERTVMEEPLSEAPAPSVGAPELAAYLSGLRVHVRLVAAKARDRPHVDRTLRTAATFSLSGEKRDLTESEVDAMLESGRCMLISVSDRLSDHGPSGLIAFHPETDSLVIDSMALSCAVLGKQVEYAVVSALAQIAEDRHCTKLVFKYSPSGRNQPMLTFLKSIIGGTTDTPCVLSVALAEQKIKEGAVAAGTWTLDFGT